MGVQTKIDAPTLAKLREPFAPNHISKLPKPTKAQTEAVRSDFKKGIRCGECGTWHHPDVVHLDYVGHAVITDRLLDTDPEWSWEPLALGPDGLPAVDRNGGLWIRLTVLGVTRLGYGDADGKTGGNAVKEAIGDALRNAAMRFGAALDLWHKGDLHAEEDAGPQGDASAPPAKREPQHSALKQKVRSFVHELNGCGDGDELSAFLATVDAIKIVDEVREKLPDWWTGWPEQPDGFTPLADLIAKRERECAAVTASYLGA